MIRQNRRSGKYERARERERELEGLSFPRKYKRRYAGKYLCRNLHGCMQKLISKHPRKYANWRVRGVVVKAKLDNARKGEVAASLRRHLDEANTQHPPELDPNASSDMLAQRANEALAYAQQEANIAQQEANAVARAS